MPGQPELTNWVGTLGLLSKDLLDSAPASLCWKLAWPEDEAEGAELRCRKKATSCADKLR